MALEATGEAAVDEYLLPVGPGEEGAGGHLAPARGAPIPGDPAVDVPRVEAHRTVVAVLPTGGQRTDEALTVAATERIPLAGVPAGLPGPLGPLITSIGPGQRGALP